MVSSGRRLVQAAVLVLLVTAPLGAAQDPGLLMLTGGLILCALACLYPFGEAPSYLPRTATSLLLFLLWGVLTLRHSLNYFHSEQRLATWVSGFAVMFAMIELNQSRKALQITTQAIAGITGLYAVACLLATYFQSEGATLPVLDLLCFSSPDACAGFMLGGIGVAVALVLNRPLRSPEWWVAVAETSVLSLAILLSRSGIGILGLVCTVGVAVVFGLLSAARSTKHRKRRTRAVGMLQGSSAAFVVLLFTMFLMGDRVGLWRVDAIVGKPASTPVRAPARMVFQGAGESFLESPWFGAGLGNFDLAYQRFRPYAAGVGYVQNAECDPLQFLVETGLVGTGLLALMWALAINPFYRRGDTTARRGALASLAGLLIFSLGNSTETLAPHILWLGALLGLAAGTPREEARRPGRYVLHGAVGLATVFLALGVQQSLFGYRVWRSAALSTSAAVLQHSSPAQALAVLSRAIELTPQSADLRVRRALLYEGASRERGVHQLMAYATEDMADAYRLASIDKDVPFDVGSYYLRHGDTEAGIEVLQRATDWYPQEPRRVVALAEAYAGQDQLERAASCYRLALPNDASVWVPLADVMYWLQARHGTAIGILNQWLKEDPKMAGTIGRMCVAAVERATREHTPLVARQFVEVLEKNQPDNLADRLELARLLDAEDDEAGERLFWQVVGLGDPASQGEEKQALLKMASSRQDRGNLRAAMRLLNRFLATHESDNDVRIALADTFERAGRLQRAIELYRDAEEHDPANGLYAERLGELLQKKGDDALARACFEQAAKLDPTNYDYATKLEEVEKDR